MPSRRRHRLGIQAGAPIFVNREVFASAGADVLSTERELERLEEKSANWNKRRLCPSVGDRWNGNHFARFPGAITGRHETAFAQGSFTAIDVGSGSAAHD